MHAFTHVLNIRFKDKNTVEKKSQEEDICF